MNILYRFELLRIDADRRNVREPRGDDLVAALFDLAIQIGLMLEAVRIEVTRIERCIRLHVIVERHDLHVEAFASRDLLHNRPCLFIGARDRAHFDDLIFGVGAGADDQYGGSSDGREELEKRLALHGYLLS